MTYAIEARPTTYRGIPMRSRLEARFAAFLDDMGYVWEYEPRAFASQAGQYLPDFWVSGTDGRGTRFSGWCVEVRPTIEKALEVLPRMQIVWDSNPEVRLVAIVPGLGAFEARTGLDDGRWRWSHFRAGGAA